MRITENNESIRIFLAAAPSVQPRCVVVYDEIGTATIDPKKNMVSANGTTPVTLVPAPATGVKHDVGTMSIYNPDPGSITVTVSIWDGTTDYELYKATVASGETVRYGGGQWRTFTSAGAEKQSLNQGVIPMSSSWSNAYLSGDTDVNTGVANTLTDIPTLEFTVEAGGRYRFRFEVVHTVAATTTGYRICIDGPSFSLLAYNTDMPNGAITRIIGNNAAYQLPTTALGTSANTAGTLSTIVGHIEASAAGTVKLQVACELASTALTVKKGSIVEWQRIY